MKRGTYLRSGRAGELGHHGVGGTVGGHTERVEIEIIITPQGICTSCESKMNTSSVRGDVGA